MDFDQASYYLRIGRLWAQEPNERGFPTNFPSIIPESSSSATTFQQQTAQDQHKFTPNPVKNIENSDAIQQSQEPQQQQVQVQQSRSTSSGQQSDFSRELKRIRDARYKQLTRLMMTDEQKEAQRERKRQKYANESHEQRENRRRKDCERRRLRWQMLPEPVRQARRARASLKARERRLRMTPEQKERKKNRDRENARKRRQRKKSEVSTSGANGQNVTSNESGMNSNDAGWLGQPWMGMNMKVEPEDYSLVTAMQRRF